MQFEYTPPQTVVEQVVGGHRCINAIGSIAPGDDDRFIRFLENSAVPPRTDMYIDSSGGDVEAALNIGRTIRESWLSTHVGSYILDDNPSDDSDDYFKPRRFIDGSCLSAATLLFLGGRLRYLSSYARFGVHQFSFRDPSPTHVGRSQILSSKIARYIADMEIASEFLEISASVESREIKLLDHSELRRLSVVTDGETSVTWTVQSKNNLLYVRGERDSHYGHHKMILGFAKPSFYVHAVIESQGRELQLTEFPIVELVIVNGEEHVVDLSDKCLRHVDGIYTNAMAMISNELAKDIADCDSFGLRIRGGYDAPMFLGIAPMSTDGATDLIRSFVNSLA